MATVTYQTIRCELREGETLLDGLLRSGAVIPFSCRGGICRTCLMQRIDDGPIPAAAQRRLTQEQKEQRCLLPCQCIPDEDMVVALPAAKAGHPQFSEEPPRSIEPDPEMWAALAQGRLLREILVDFYTRVYQDPLLAPFFTHTTRQRSIEKQFNFLYQVFTGEDVYFGERPRNAHHWMVISDELFDYRDRLMKSVLREHGLPERLIRRWGEMEGGYRPVIVKDRAWPKIIDGRALPLEGYESMRLDCGALCDGCGGEVDVGEMIRVHVRLGTAYCARCAPAAQADPA